MCVRVSFLHFHDNFRIIIRNESFYCFIAFTNVSCTGLLTCQPRLLSAIFYVLVRVIMEIRSDNRYSLLILIVIKVRTPSKKS